MNRRPEYISRMGFHLLLFAVCVVVSFVGCDNSAHNSNSPASAEKHVDSAVVAPLPNVDQRLCTGVVLLVDTSGSMEQQVSDGAGGSRPKHRIARNAIERIIAYTDTWKADHPDRTLHFGIYGFSSSARRLLDMAEFDAATARAAVARMPEPAGGTAIGSAIRAGFDALYSSGCVRRYVVCITDGENTSGPRPGYVARNLYEKTNGDVEMHFVAFDTSADHFAFLSEVNGTVVEAADAAQLEARLAEIYKRRIFAEEMNVEAP